MKHRFIFILPLFLLFACKQSSSEEIRNSPKEKDTSFSTIMKRGSLVVLFGNNASSYFNYRGTDMGFEYEILEAFCREFGLELEIKEVENQDELFQSLADKTIDIVAGNLAVTNDRKKKIDFSSPILYTHQVLVQRKKSPGSNSTYIDDVIELSNKKVNVWQNSAFYSKLKNIQNEIGDTIYIYGENGDMSVDYLIEQVSDGTIDYTISDQNIAVINQFYWDNIDISLDVSFTQKIAFGLSKNQPMFKAALDSWLKEFMQTDSYRYLKYKYFELPITAQKALQLDHPENATGIIRIIKRKTKHTQLNWELVVALVHRESRFNPNIIGLGGAYGLFQFMPHIGHHFDVFPNSTVEEQIEGGIRLLQQNYNLWKNIESHEERLKFTLAGYNSGASHVYDAIALAKKHHLNPHKWDNNVALMFAKLSSPEYYNDPVVKSGSARGVHTVNYVQDVYSNYLRYKNIRKN